MESLITSIKWAFFILIIFRCTNQACAEDSNAIPPMKVLWQKEVTPDANLDCSLGPVAFDKTNRRLLITGTSFHPKEYSEGKFWLLETDANNGNIVRKTTIKKATESKAALMSASSLIKSLTVSENNDISLVGKFDDPIQSIMKTNRQGNISKPIEFINKNSRGKESVLILNGINLLGDNLLLVGRDENGNGVAIKVGPDGIKLWEKTYKVGQGRADLFCDGSFIGNTGDFIIVGCSANVSSKPPALEQSNDFILRCDSQGNILKKEFFPVGSAWHNKLPQMCRLNDGELLVAYDKDTGFATSDINIRAYNSDLNLLWEKKVLKSSGIVLLKIAPIKKDGFVLATNTVSGDLEVYQYNGKGNQIAGVTIDKKVCRIAFSPGLTCAENNAFIVAQSIPEEKKGREPSKIKIIALELKQSKD